MERSLLPVAYRTGVYRPARFLNRRRAVILTYHGFTDRRDPPGIENADGKHVHVDDFRDQIAFLARHYQVLPLADVVHRLAGGEVLPDRVAALTMDDGYRSTHMLAFPILQAAGVPATIFVATEFVDGRRWLWTDRVEYAVDRAAAGTYDVPTPAGPVRVSLNGRDSRAAADRQLRSALKTMTATVQTQVLDDMEHVLGVRLDTASDVPEIYQPFTWSEAAAMTASGVVDIGSHTHTHAILSRCTPDRAADELRRSRTIIETRLQRPCPLFCYPNGRRGDFNATTTRLVRDSGYICALTTVHGMNPTGADVYMLKRYPVTGRMARGELAVRLSGLIELPARLRDSAGTWRGAPQNG